MRTDPKHLYICGPLALRALMLAQHAAAESLGFLEWYRAGGPKGVSLAELARLAEKGSLPYRPIFRKPGQAVPVPSIVHWKVGHFGAVVGEAGGRFHIIDPVFGSEGLWVTRAALDAEASGYFLAPIADRDEARWRSVALADAGRV
jgi:ABC-type bacteriocin/lantibiotic exporter with double-glycine peptidase domain